MWHDSSNKHFLGGYKLPKVLLCLGLLLFLIMALFCHPFVNFDSIGWSSGFSHPLTGWDHLVTMLAVGIWAAQLRGHAVWILPLAFVSVMSVGGLAGTAGLTIPSVEGLILLSCAVFSLLIVRRARFSTQVNVMIVAFFAFFHGFAHGQEISTSASLISYTLGFMLATLLLHGAGIIVAKLVVLSVTCLIAMFLSSIAQANHAEPAGTGKGKNITLVRDLGAWQISPSRMTFDQQLDFARTCHTEADPRRLIDDIPIHCEDTGDDSKAGPPDIACQWSAVKSFAKILYENNDIEGNAPVLAAKRVTILAQELSQKVQHFCYPDYLYVSNLDFRHLYPDINHTPGKDLLSNGVGLTSPPEFDVHLVVPQILSSFRKLPRFTFEDQALQITVAEFIPGNLTLTKNSNPTRVTGAILIPTDPKIASVTSLARKILPNFFTPQSLFYPNRLVVNATSDFVHAGRIAGSKVSLLPRFFSINS